MKIAFSQDTVPPVLPVWFHAGLILDASVKCSKEYLAPCKRPPSLPYITVGRERTGGIYDVPRNIHLLLKHSAHVFMKRDDVVDIQYLTCICSGSSTLDDASVTNRMSLKAF